MKRRLFAFAATAALLQGCAGVVSTAPPPALAEVTAPPAWRTATPDGSALSPRWWRGFGDPVLDALVDQALARNTDVAVAAARVDEARALERLARSGLSPTLDLAGGGQDGRALNAFGQPYEAAAGQAELRVGYEVDLWGRLAGLDEAGRAALQASEAARAATRLAVAGAVARSYVTLRSLDAQLLVVRESAATRREAVRLARRRHDAGYTGALETAQAEAELAAALQRAPVLEQAILRQETALSVLCGDPPRAVRRGLALTEVVLPAVPAGGVPSDLLRGRPDIAAAEAQLTSADASLYASRASLLPQVRLTGSLTSLASEALGDPAGLWSVGGSLLAPLFNGGRIRAQGDAQEARRDQAAFAYRAVVLNGFAEVETTLSATGRLAEQETEIEAQRRALTQAYALSRNRYRAGYASYLEQIDAQRGVLAADLSWLQAREARLLASIALAQALGGGWTPDA